MLEEIVTNLYFLLIKPFDLFDLVIVRAQNLIVYENSAAVAEFS